jgi:DNA damage-binding protein 1
MINSKDVIIAKAGRLEIRQLHSSQQEYDRSGALPILLQLPLNGRLIALHPLSIPSLQTSVIFMLQDRYQYAAISYYPQPPSLPKTPGQTPKVAVYPVFTHASGSLETANISRPSEGGTIVAVDPFFRCIAIHAFDGLLTIVPVDLNYSPPSNAKADDDEAATRVNPRRPKQVLGTPFHCRIEESTILAITFLHTTSLPQIAVLHQDSRGAQHLTTHAIQLQKQQIFLHGSSAVPASVTWLKKSSLDGGSSLLVPIQLPHPSTAQTAATTQNTVAASSTEKTDASQKRSVGVLVIGQRQWTYCSPTTTKIIPVPAALYLAFTPLPNDPASGMPRFLFADEFGHLHMLSFLVAPNLGTGVSMQLDTLGSVPLASTLTYLRDGFLYVGSCLGDSQLLQIHDEPIVTGDMQDNSASPEGADAAFLDSTYVTVAEEYTNLGPILDFDLVPTTLPSGTSASSQLVQSQVVTASGSSKSGSIRVVRNGIGMNEYASVEIPGIQAMWSIRKSYEAAEDSFLVQSFVGETRVLGVSTSEDQMMTSDYEEGNEAARGTLEEVILPGLDATASTLYVGNMESGSRLLQITASEVRLLEFSGEIVSTWSSQITIATANESGQIALSLPGGILVYLVIDGDAIRKVHEKQFDREVSCIDIQPFSSNCTDEVSMEIDKTSSSKRLAVSSSLIAVGLWDDFTVRLLSTDDSLTELECIFLGSIDEEEGVNDRTAVNPSRQNRNTMMARSICLVTLDFSSSSGNNYGYKKESQGIGVDMLFIGMGDGTLVSFAVAKTKTAISIQSKKEVCLGTQRIDLVKLKTEQGGTCVLATGDRPTVIYLAGVVGSENNFNPKLCYSNVNVQSDELDGMDQSISNPHGMSINIACPFYSLLLFDNSALGKQQYSLCVANDSSLRLGVIDDIQKLHVTTCRLGMAPRRIVHCPEGRVFAVGCIESDIQNYGLGSNEATLGNCIRFLDETSFDDLEKIDLEPFEMILSMIYASVSVPSLVKEATSNMSSTETRTVHKPLLFVGTAYALPDEDEPVRGRILVYSCQSDASNVGSGRAIRQITEFSTEGGVYSMCQFYEGRILATVNSRTHVCQLVEDVGLLRLQYLGLGHFGHILSLFVKSRVQRVDKSNASPDSRMVLPMNAPTSEEKSSQVDRTEPEEMIAIVGDLMRSISLVQYYPQHQTVEEIARDFNSNWTCAVEMLSDSIYLGAENWNNLFCLRRNLNSTNEDVQYRLDTIGEYHLGEMCNKFMAGSLVMPVFSRNAGSSAHRNSRRSGTPLKKSGSNSSPSKLASRFRRPVVSIGSQTLYGTVDGSLGVILGLDARTAAFFATLERAMSCVIRHVGDFGHQQYRACHAERRMHPAHGFVDGDLVESFLDLNRSAMDAVVTEMNRDGGWDVDDSDVGDRKDPASKAVEQDGAKDDVDMERHDLAVEDVLAMVEEMTMLH